MPSPDSALGTVMDFTSKFKQESLDAEEVFHILLGALAV